MLECAFIPIPSYILGPDSPQTVYSEMSSYLPKSPFLMVGAMIYECLTYSFIISPFNYALAVQLGILRSTQWELEAGLRDLNSTQVVTSDRLLQHAAKCRRIQLRIAYFNKVYSWCIHILKLESLFDGTFGIFLGIKTWETHPMLAVFGASMGLMDIACFCAMYSRGYEIPSLIQEYTRKIELKASRVGTLEYMEVRKVARSFPKVAIKVGQFHELERSSTTEILDFLVNNIVNLLVSYPDPIVF